MTVKSRLLEILEKEKGETLSGEKLAEELHCTRAAIWKAVKSLREEGYMIEAGPNKGYMLMKANDRLSVEAIRPFLSFPDVYIKVYQEVDSTNRAAKAAACIIAQIHNDKIIGSLSSHFVQIKGLVVKFNRSIQV